MFPADLLMFKQLHMFGGKEEFWTFRVSGTLRDTRGFMFNTMSVLDVFTSFLCPFSSEYRNNIQRMIAFISQSKVRN